MRSSRHWAVRIALAIALMAGIVPLWACTSDDDPELDCITGDAATNQIGASGSPIPAGEEFATVAEAESFLCLDVPDLGDLEGWTLSSAAAYRGDSIDQYSQSAWVSDRGLPRWIELAYTSSEFDDGRGWILNLNVHPLATADRLDFPSCDELAELIEAATDGPLVGGEAQQLMVGNVEATHWTWATPEVGQPRTTTCWERDGLRYSAAGAYRDTIDPATELAPVFAAIE